MMMISSLLIVAVVVLAVGRVEKSTVLFHAFHRPVFHFPEFTIPKPELTLQFDLPENILFLYCRKSKVDQGDGSFGPKSKKRWTGGAKWSSKNHPSRSTPGSKYQLSTLITFT